MMTFKKRNLIITYVIISVSLIILLSYSFVNLKINVITNNTYNQKTEEIKNQIDFLIQNKKKETLSLALVLSQDKYIIDALEKNKSKYINLNNISKTLKIFDNFKNIWFHIIDKNGNDFYRSWMPTKDDHIITIRKDLQKIFNDRKVISTISVGQFDMSFKSIVPILNEDGSFLGVFEIITHFNSIAKEIEKDNLGIVVLANKKYKNQLKNSISKIFIDNYYVSNLDVKMNNIKIIKDIGIENVLNNTNKYFLDKKNRVYITTYKINTNIEKALGYIIIIKDINSFNVTKINDMKNNVLLIGLFFVILSISIGYYLINREYNQNLNKKLLNTKQEKEVLDSILSAQPYIIILIYDKEIDYVNNKFFHFFTQYKTLSEFKEEHQCICDFFVKFNSADENYIEKTSDWLDNISKDKEYKVLMSNGERERDFIIKATNPNIDFIKSKLTILTLVDITDIRNKDKLLFEQSKLASMGEMIGNIAHQWRQPLSVISTISTGIKMHKELGNLSDENLIKNCNSINENAQYLSKTIDDFKNFIKGDRTKRIFNLKSSMNSFLHLVKGTITTQNINIILDIDSSINVNGYENDLIQCFINIFNNSKDALNENKIENKLIFISSVIDENKLTINIKDNANGIPKNILPKIFEAYFTTKHKSQGTGLGLNMTYKLITEGMNGVINVNNIKYTYKNKTYSGVEFTIILDI